MRQNIQRSYKKVLEIIEFVDTVICIVLLAAIVVIGATEVFLRFVFSSSLPWAVELNIFLATWLYFLGFGLLAMKGGYIYVDYLYKFLPHAVKRVLELVVPLGILLFSVVVLYKGIELQPIQRRLLVFAFPIPLNYYSLAVVVCMALLILVTIYELWMRIEPSIDPSRREGGHGSREESQ